MATRFDVDVLVVGGGMAGVAVAVTTARRGLKTLLVESQGTLGGLATNGLVIGVAGAIEGLSREFLDRMAAADALSPRPHTPSFDPEQGKFVLENMLLEAGARILYWTWAVDALVENSRVQGVVCHSKSGRIVIGARMVVDTTGDADVAAAAGVPWETGGTEFAGLNMSTTLAFRMANVDLRRYREAVQLWRDRKPAQISLLAELMEEAVQAGDLPYFIFPTALIYPVPQTPEDNADIAVMTTHSFYARNLDVEDLTRQAIEQHQQIGWMTGFFRKYVAGFERSRMTAVASLHGVRDSRRIVGEYVLRDVDVAGARKFPDGVAKFPEFFDTHHPTDPRLGFIRHIHVAGPGGPAVCRPAECPAAMHPFGRPGGAYEARVNPAEYCEVPYRSLVPLKIDNLLVAGRCISAEFHALAAVRVIATCMSTGQAAGVAAALCLQENVVPRQLDGRRVREALINQGVPLDRKPDGHWAAVREMRGEYVVVPGDFIGVLTPEGIRTPL